MPPHVSGQDLPAKLLSTTGQVVLRLENISQTRNGSPSRDENREFVLGCMK
jgi:hypothetical protein